MLLHAARFAELDTRTVYAILRLRCDVFVVEQQCPYPELDGRDVEPDTVHLWLEDAGPAGLPDRHAHVASYLRMLSEPDGSARIGRVCTAPARRGAGLAGRLMAAALQRIDRIDPGTGCVLDAQAHLVAFYARFGFVPTGPEYLEDGIPHVPMRRDRSPIPGRARV